MRRTFRNTESATAYNATWQLMKSAPAEFVGDQFVGEAAVLAYVEPKLAAVLAYAKMRLARIKQFQDERAAIMA